MLQGVAADTALRERLAGVEAPPEGGATPKKPCGC